MALNTLKLHNTCDFKTNPVVVKPNLFGAILSKLVSWQERASMRHQLRHLDEENLIDMGISRQQAKVEADKPFWWYKK
jgi:uncharacterized protein YjiS (DUF1127 family)